jgi:hypothetical protein
MAVRSGAGGILDGTDTIINDHLTGGKGSFRHKSVGTTLTRPDKFSGRLLLEDLVTRIEGNLTTGFGPRGHSRENWRDNSPSYQHEDRSYERDLEHRLANFVGRTDCDWRWWNQMPIASGLVGKASDKTRAVDLVRQRKNDLNSYQLIELKITQRAGSPLVAVMEILRYGLVYFVLRNTQKPAWFKGAWVDERPIFKAKRIDLCVLAPQDYYVGYELGWLEKELSVGLMHLCEIDLAEDASHGELTMSVQCFAMRTLKKWVEKITDEAALISIRDKWQAQYQ